jgi:2-haloacid dehalogenase
VALDRRQFLKTGLAGTAGALANSGVRAAGGKPKFKAMAFDAFPVFDPRPVAALAETLFPGKGAELIGVWRTRQFEYTWLRTIAGRYSDFMQVTDDALVFAAKTTKVALAADQRDRLLGAYLELKTWPEVTPALMTLKAAGIRLAFLSNFTPAMLHGCIAASGIAGIFDEVLSTDAAQTYKPDPRAYRLGVDALKLRREDIMFVAFAGWDAAGAKSFGYPTFWVNRLGLPPEELGSMPDGVGADLMDLLAYVVP